MGRYLELEQSNRDADAYEAQLHRQSATRWLLLGGAFISAVIALFWAHVLIDGIEQQIEAGGLLTGAGFLALGFRHRAKARTLDAGLARDEPDRA